MGKTILQIMQTEEIQARIAELEKENKYLKSLLDDAGINYTCQNNETADRYDANQGARILQKSVTEEDANRFFSMFWGRTDVYAKRSIKKSTGEASYYTQCDNFWKQGCPRRTGSKIKCRDCDRQQYSKLGIRQILSHLKGESSDATDVIGIYPLLADHTCRFIVFDFDNHDKNAEKRDFANTDDAWKEEVDTVRDICEINGIDALTERSRSGQGAHIWIFFQKPIEAVLARKFGNALLEKGAESINMKTFRYYDRMLPMQDFLPEGSIGNLIALPLQGKALLEGNSAFIDENWNAYPDQWKALFSKQKLSQEFIESRLQEWKVPDSSEDEENVDLPKDGEKPWDKTKDFHREDVDGALSITLADGIYIDTNNLKARIQNQIRRLAAFSNPVFFKNQAIGLSNFENSRIIYLGKDEGDYIRIPRGLLEKLNERCEKAGIPCSIDDKRCGGREIRVVFSGLLKESQTAAADALLKKDTGILDAATAFGKTVVCCSIIARKKVNTLILLQSSSLLEQWQKALEKFLTIDEEPPEYLTAGGRKKRRKSAIGFLQNSHDSMTGIIDVAMVGSLCKKEEFHPLLKEYGLVILDECHHAAADTIVSVLQEVRAKYVYGVSATPFRGDGLEKINFMLLGPIRYKFTAKDRAKEQGIEHLVYPRFTRAVAPKLQQEHMHPNEAYELIRDNDERDRQIAEDVRKCIHDGRTPVILSKYIDHSLKLFGLLKDSADKVFLLTGHDSKKEHKEVLEKMDHVSSDETMLLIATGKLIGEGFDFPRLDTLIMATPVSGRNVVEQYAGRLNRDYEGKKSVVIYDYVDSHISMFDKMYYKRLKAYKQIGYDIFNGEKRLKQEVNSIFSIDNYQEIFQKDLLGAASEIIISSPAISGRKVYDMMALLKEKQESGVKVVIVTWNPDSYGYGDSGYWMKLQEDMRQGGFEMELVDDFCEHYCVIDKEIVWYGSMNFLGKEDAEDNLMRVCSKRIAAEVLELTFGKAKVMNQNENVTNCHALKMLPNDKKYIQEI